MKNKENCYLLVTFKEIGKPKFEFESQEILRISTNLQFRAEDIKFFDTDDKNVLKQD